MILRFTIAAFMLSGMLAAQVAPFVTATWNQGCYYNAMTPTVPSGGSCGRAYTGCNATALAMICKYYAWPANGIGGTHCNTNFTTHCVNFGAQTYNFASMPLNVTSANPEVAKLMYNLGVACNMQWGAAGSGSFFDGELLKKYFAYSPKMYNTASYMFPTTTDLINALKAELNAGRPVFAKGGDHFYVIDGYNASNKFHVNFGWGGVHNGYYTITSIVNAQGNFTPTNFMFMIKPIDGTLEFASDTIVVPANPSLQALNFSTLSSFTLNSSVSWINPSLMSGGSGFHTFSNGGTFSVQVNNGGIRYGNIVIQNANSTKTLVVKQEASPLDANPSPLNYTAGGETKVVNVNYSGWGTWTVSTSQSWLSLSTTMGVGSDSFSVTASTNTSSASRNGWVIIKVGAFTDSIAVVQAGQVSTTLAGHEKEEFLFELFPNPAEDFLVMRVSDAQIGKPYVVYDSYGKMLLAGEFVSREFVMDVSGLSNGLYYLRTGDFSKKLLIQKK